MPAGFSRIFTLALLMGALFLMAGCARRATTKSSGSTKSNGSGKSAPKKRDVAQRLGTTFRDLDLAQLKGVEVIRLEIPEYPGGYAIWGGTGRDDLGNVWIGVCTWPKIHEPSAHLFRLEPGSKEFTPAEDVVSMLKKLGAHRAGEGQMKIHSKLVPMDDGWVYFSSMDEQGEKEDGSKLPTWGGHLWRMRADKPAWERLISVPEALIAVAGVGRYVFSLGYFGHVVYRYDTVTGDVKRQEVGSYRGHISRNFLADDRGHCYVPRIVEEESDNPKDDKKPNLRAELVELDHDLVQVASFPLNEYPADGTAETHGITGISYLTDESMTFTTSSGALYRVTPGKSQPAKVEHLGWFHPDGSAYAPSLVSFDGRRYLSGLSSKKGSSNFDWVTYDLASQSSTYEPFPVHDDPDAGIRGLLLYGSLTQDFQGNAYLVGQYINNDGNLKPICLQVRPRKNDIKTNE